MTADELREHLDRLGGRLDTWPPAIAAEARALIERSDAARSVYREAQALDELLQHALASDHQATPGLEQRIFDNLRERDPWQAVIDWFATSFWRPMVTAALPLALGFTLGWVFPESEQDDFYEDLATLTFYDAYETYLEFDDE